MTTFQIWMEGYSATGQGSTAQYCGSDQADTFDQAVIKNQGDNLDKDKNEPDGYRRRAGRLCCWACRFFDNEQDARKSSR